MSGGFIVVKVKTLAKVAAVLCFAAIVVGGDASAASKSFFKSVLSGQKASASSDFQIDSDGVLLHYSGSSEEVVVPKGVKSIAFGAFMEHSEIKSISLPEGLISVDECAFYGCAGLQSVRLPESVERIYRLAFGGCASLEKMYMGKNVKELAELFVCDCPKLCQFEVSAKNKKFQVVDGILYSKDMEDLILCPQNGPEVVSVPDGVVTIKEQSFFECENLKSIDIGKNVRYIDEAAFYGCKNLKDVNMGDSVKKIRSYAFAECPSLEEFRLGKNVRYIGNGAFFSSNNLRKFVCLGKEIEFGVDVFTEGLGITLCVPDDSDGYRFAVNNKYNFEII